MKNIIALLIAFISLTSCDLNKLDPAQDKAFVKYFGDVGNTIAVDLLKVTDGYVLLGTNIASGVITTVIIRVDNDGNTMWTNTFDDFIGRGLAQAPDGYLIVGDGINDPDLSTMRLIKTNPEGAETARASLGDAAEPYHGAAVTVTSTGEIVVSGTIDNSSTTNQTFLYGYDANLGSDWTVRKFPPADGNFRYAAKSIYEDDLGNIIWSELANSNGVLSYNIRSAGPDSPTPGPGGPVFLDKVLLEKVGDISSSFNNTTAALQSIRVNGREAIGLYIHTASGDLTHEIAKDNTNLAAGSVSIINRSQGDEFIIVGSTDDHPEDNTRSDTNFYIAKVEFNGEIIWENSFGGTGDESAIAVVPADDGGFVMLGNLRNTNEVNLMVLAKVNENGALVN